MIEPSDKEILEFLLNKFQMHSPKMNGQHSYRFMSSEFPMNRAKGPSARDAVINAMREEEKSVKEFKENYPDYMFEEAQRRELATKALDKLYDENGAALQQLAEIERKEFYRFFAVEYYGTGEGISYWLKICRNYPPYNGEDLDLECFKNFINDSYHSQYIEEPTEEEFMSKYSNLIPAHIVKMVEYKNQPELIWETYFHVNYS